MGLASIRPLKLPEPDGGQPHPYCVEEDLKSYSGGICEAILASRTIDAPHAASACLEVTLQIFVDAAVVPAQAAIRL